MADGIKDLQTTTTDVIDCPICATSVSLQEINAHLDNDCNTRKITTSTTTSQRSDHPFGTPTQTRYGISSKKEIPETPLQSSNYGKGSQKRKYDDLNDRESPRPSVDHSQPEVEKAETRSKPTPRGKEAIQKAAPLAERVRPRTLEDFVGQEDLVGSAGLLRGLIDAGRIPSLILWGSSGTGKTTLARIIAKSSGEHEYVFKELSATNNNVADCKKVFEDASNLLTLTGKKTLVFLDEIHRFTKSQQDIFLPYVESGKITLIGATTENPSFRINNALISRCRVFILAKLSTKDIETILDRALDRVEETLPPEVCKFLAGLSDGDARVALNLLDMVLSLPRETITIDSIRASLKRTTIAYDMKGDEHYDCISALHKSIRGSHVDASLYYLGRMLEGGEDPLYIARRMVRIASEDVGMADCQALPLCSAIYTSVQQVGMPEADCILAQGVVYLAQAPKSVSVYKAYKSVKKLLRSKDGAAGASIPLHLRNAPTSLMKELGYGKDYIYNPDHDGQVEQEYLPETLREETFYTPDEEIEERPVWNELDEGERML